MTLSLRTLKPADHAWITRLAHEGERAGHFNGTTGKNSPQLLSAIAQGKPVIMQKMRNGEAWMAPVRPHMWVADWEGARAGFILCFEDEEGYELSMAATDSRYRRRGCFRALVEHAMAQAPADIRIYARCYTPSYAAVALFEELGFLRTSSGTGSAPDEFTYMPTVPAHLTVSSSSPMTSFHRPWWARMLSLKSKG